MNTDYTDITLVLDRSGSMAQIRSDMEGAMKTFVEDQAQHPGECLLSVLQFDSSAIEWVFQGKPIAQVKSIALEPRGSTPLLDALGRAILETGQRLGALPEAARPGRVLVVVITDGLENASRELTGAQVKAMVEQQRSVYKWEFLFFGANIDAAAEAAAIGIASAAGYVASKKGVESMGKKVRYAASSFRTFGDVKQGLDQADKEDAEEQASKPSKIRPGTRPVN